MLIRLNRANSSLPLNVRLFFAYVELEKMRSMRSDQHQVQLRLLSNQLQVLGKANSLWKIVKKIVCFACLLRLCPGHVGPGIKITRVILARSVQRLDDVLLYSTSCATWWWENIVTPAFSSAMSRFFFRPCWHLWKNDFDPSDKDQSLFGTKTSGQISPASFVNRSKGAGLYGLYTLNSRPIHATSP